MTTSQWIKPWIELLFDYEKRGPLALYLSLIYNLLFALFKLASGVLIGSYWMIALASYYGCLAIMRFLLLLHLNREQRAAWRAYKNTGLLLLVLTIIIGGIVGQAYVLGKTYQYPGFLIYAFGAFAFGKIITVTRTLFKRRKEPNIILKASRCISFAHALMSILSLQIALLNRFCQNNPGFARGMNGLLGGFIFLVIHGQAVYMIHHGNLGLKKCGPSKRTEPSPSLLEALLSPFRLIDGTQSEVPLKKELLSQEKKPAKKRRKRTRKESFSKENQKKSFRKEASRRKRKRARKNR